MSKLNQISKMLEKATNERKAYKDEIARMKLTYKDEMLPGLINTENELIDASFNNDLNRGFKLIDDKIAELKSRKLDQLSGKNYPEDAILLNGTLKLTNQELQELVDRNKNNMLFARMAQSYADQNDYAIVTPQGVEEKIAYIEDFKSGFHRVLKENYYTDDNFGASMIMSQEVNPKLYEAFEE